MMYWFEEAILRLLVRLVNFPRGTWADSVSGQGRSKTSVSKPSGAPIRQRKPDGNNARIHKNVPGWSGYV
jgi:hypothetical protein